MTLEAFGCSSPFRANSSRRSLVRPLGSARPILFLFIERLHIRCPSTSRTGRAGVGGAFAHTYSRTAAVGVGRRVGGSGGSGLLGLSHYFQGSALMRDTLASVYLDISFSSPARPSSPLQRRVELSSTVDARWEGTQRIGVRPDDGRAWPAIGSRGIPAIGGYMYAYINKPYLPPSARRRWSFLARHHRRSRRHMASGKRSQI